ncbi:MAG TPA: ABC transporter ATP-binding protein [Candidatus Cloacimonadota bacterium]|nr:ABC transporter ATP-binding protein [Candidatus Cloacimonadota bacterium]HOF59668.1 ABC transporter ATP-binding protein [Candidatus Cloacimonadota bacterium]HOR58943.1 ABC transporter ATP-binding protein [Candidatus Cloacimonadota bacterium]HPB09081.1 ABC transporter ATP-binding protein [Candidatus Cloacimonadota bacterium]HPL23171.1 ABC transporter ATP-binding protein [Candidatus Cloacimonadota bacterium]
MSETIYQINNLTKHYGKFKALDAVNLKIGKGKIIGLLGKNGAGKSTLMRCMLGFLRHEGNVELYGGNVARRNHRIFENVAFIPDVSGLDDRLTVAQTIDYVRGVNSRWNEERAAQLFALSNLPLKKKVGKLSKGMKTKLYLLITLSLDVNMLLLDEPTLGLDIAFRKEFFNTILGEFFNEERSILISTHQVEEVEDLLQEIIIIDNGRIILHEEVEALKERYRVVSLPSDRSAEILAHSPKVTSKTLGFFSAVLDSKVEIPGATYGRVNLADIFLSVVGGSNETA